MLDLVMDGIVFISVCPGTPVQRMSLLSEIEAHLILRISQLTHDTLQKLGDRRSLMQPPLMAAVDETDELTQDDLAKIVEAALREYRLVRVNGTCQIITLLPAGSSGRLRGSWGG